MKSGWRARRLATCALEIGEAAQRDVDAVMVAIGEWIRLALRDMPCANRGGQVFACRRWSHWLERHILDIGQLAGNL